MRYLLLIITIISLVGCSDSPSPTEPPSIKVHPSSLNVPYGEPLGFQLQIDNPNDFTIQVKVEGSYHILGGETTYVEPWYAHVQVSDPTDPNTHVHIAPDVIWDGPDDIIMIYTFKFTYGDQTGSITIETPMQGSGLTAG